MYSGNSLLWRTLYLLPRNPAAVVLLDIMNQRMMKSPKRQFFFLFSGGLLRSPINHNQRYARRNFFFFIISRGKLIFCIPPPGKKSNTVLSTSPQPQPLPQPLPRPPPRPPLPLPEQSRCRGRDNYHRYIPLTEAFYQAQLIHYTEKVKRIKRVHPKIRWNLRNLVFVWRRWLEDGGVVRKILKSRRKFT